MYLRPATDFHRCRQHLGREGEDVGTAGSLALIVHQPYRPGLPRIVSHRLDRPRAIWHRMGGIGDVLGVICARERPRESEPMIGLQVQRPTRGRTSALAAEWPALKPAPLIDASLECRDRRDVGWRGTVFQILREKGTQDLLAKILGGIAAESNHAQGAAFLDFLTVIPGS